MAENDIEIAPMGTRALLRDVAKHLREDEVGLRESLADASVTQDSDGESLVPSTPGVLNGLTAAADRKARLAGRVDALLAGWEPEA